MYVKLSFALTALILAYQPFTTLGASQQSSAQEFVDYENLKYQDYMAFGSEQRGQVFRDMTPEQRVRLMKTHVQSCRDVEVKKGTLSEAQLEVIDEVLTDFVTEEMFTFPLTEEQKKVWQRRQRKLQGYFTGDQVAQFFSMFSVCRLS